MVDKCVLWMFPLGKFVIQIERNLWSDFVKFFPLMSITYTRSPLLPCHSTYILYHIISHRVESFRVPGSVPPTVVRSKSSFVHSLPQLTHKTTSDSTSSTLTSHHYNRAEQVSLICGRCLCAINRHSSNKDDGEVEDNNISSALYPAMHRSTHQTPLSPLSIVPCFSDIKHWYIFQSDTDGSHTSASARICSSCCRRKTVHWFVLLMLQSRFTRA